ncbi:MAG: YebC/PmpR family DNA-binding transcriptional regulator [Sandaracinaceae bacterium]|nr:YebC/PmpR family DNA-binding transcriptional regulator [Sandaracinaceae bacterium]
MSGHNKWSSIKHRKGRQDVKRSKMFTKVIKELTIAARFGGGDPGGNPRLRRAIDEARSINMPADNIDRAIKKGTGELEGVSYEELTYEGVGAGGTLVLVEVLTDNRNRTSAEVRKVFERNGGQMGQVGSAGWAFDQKGVVRVARDAATEEQLFEIAVGAGAEDLRGEDEQWVVTTDRTDLDVVRDAIDAAGIPVSGSKLEQIAKLDKELGGEEGKTNVGLLEALDDHDDVQNVYSDFTPSEELIAELDA